MKKRFLFMLFFLFFLMGIAWSQTGTVKGTVTSGEVFRNKYRYSPAEQSGCQ